MHDFFKANYCFAMHRFFLGNPWLFGLVNLFSVYATYSYVYIRLICYV